MEKMIITCGGRIKARRCQALSKRTKVQCGQASARNHTVCKWHGSKSTGPRTVAGKKRCAAAKTIHGMDTREMRIKYRLKMKELDRLFNMLPKWYSWRAK